MEHIKERLPPHHISKSNHKLEVNMPISEFILNQGAQNQLNLSHVFISLEYVSSNNGTLQ
jgi:hypothetical protein